MVRFASVVVAIAVSMCLGLSVSSAFARTALARQQTIALGKWPEGIAVVGAAAWVAESGQRRVAQIDLRTGQVTARLQVGRLPVQIIRGPDGMLYTLVHTDKKIMAIDPRTHKVTRIATLPDCPAQMVYADRALWVLLWQGCSSADSSVLRVDLVQGQRTRSASMGADAWSLAVGQGHVWIAHGNGTLSKLDQASLSKQASLQAGTWHRHIVTDGEALFTDDAGGSVLRLDPHTEQVTHRAVLGEVLTALSRAADTVIALGQNGAIWFLDAATLAVRAQRPSSAELRAPRAAIVYEQTLLVTTHTGKGEAGSLVVLPLAMQPEARP